MTKSLEIPQMISYFHFIDIDYPVFVKTIFAYFNFQNYNGGLYFFLPLTGYDNGDFNSYTSPSGFKDNDISPLFIHNMNPLLISYVFALASYLAV